ncbi:CHAD domain-containing protein [Leifsonia sp. NPDC058292]|uniref:CHAD domain-containing protein n=1 Tax=Leifsonia sp. NPDC058292 TaxID=3346428 RepID=UPI0036D899F4
MFALTRLSAELAEQLVAVEAHGEDAVHQARTRVRRLRSVLGVYRRAFDQDATRRLRARLRELGRVLGDARDFEVRSSALEDLLAAQSAPDVVDAVTAFAADARREYAGAERALLARLRSRSHRALLADLQAFAATPPLRKRARKHPDALISAALDTAIARVRMRATGLDTLEHRHDLRKAARRLRYAAEAVGDTTGDEVARLASAAEVVQDALGDNRDLLLLAAHLRARASETRLSASARAGIARLTAGCEAEADERLAAIDEPLAVLLEA